MKSSAHKALASLQHKHHALIRQHGKLKNEIKAAQYALAYGGAAVADGRSLAPHAAALVFEAPYGAEPESPAFDNALLKDNIAELEATIERLEFDLRSLVSRGNPSRVYRDDVDRAQHNVALAQNNAARAISERDDAKQAVWIYSLLSFVVGVAGTYGTLFAYGLVPGIY